MLPGAPEEARLCVVFNEATGTDKETVPLAEGFISPLGLLVVAR
jgi:hypothetical protein